MAIEEATAAGGTGAVELFPGYDPDPPRPGYRARAVSIAAAAGYRLHRSPIDTALACGQPLGSSPRPGCAWLLVVTVAVHGRCCRRRSRHAARAEPAGAGMGQAAALL